MPARRPLSPPGRVPPAPAVPEDDLAPDTHGQGAHGVDGGEGEGGREVGREDQVGKDALSSCVEDFDGPIFGGGVDLVGRMRERGPFDSGRRGGVECRGGEDFGGTRVGEGMTPHG